MQVGQEPGLMQQMSPAGQKLAVVLRAAVICTLQVLECDPAHEPDQLPSTKPGAGNAVSVTLVPN